MFDIDDLLIYHPNIILTSDVYDILNNMHKYLRNWAFNFRKVVRQQIWGEVVDFILAFFQFIWECNSENMIKIGPYLPKLLQEKFGAVFLAHPVYSLLSTHEAWAMEHTIIMEFGTVTRMPATSKKRT